MWKSVVLWRRWSTCHWGCRLTKIQQWMFRRHYIWVWGMYLSCSLFSWHTTTGFLWAGWRWALQRRGGGPRLEGMGRQRRHSGSLRVRGRGQGSNSRLYFSQLYTTKHKIKAIAFSEIILLALQGALRLVRTVIQMCRQLHQKNRTNPSPAQGARDITKLLIQCKMNILQSQCISVSVCEAKGVSPPIAAAPLQTLSLVPIRLSRSSGCNHRDISSW